MKQESIIAGIYKDSYVDENGTKQTKIAQYFGLFPERFSEFMEKLNRIIDLNEGIIPKKERTLKEISDSIIAHSIDD